MEVMLESSKSDYSGWDEHQLSVITRSSESRIVVNAGPGTGKTAVACARLAYLIKNEDIEPSNTLMISFTRTAVAEVRSRLFDYVEDLSFSIRVATIDSHAWSIHSGHDSNAKLTGSYEENIERVIELLTHNEDVADELWQIEHVVIDEAQDLVGRRADLVEALIKGLAPECGVTIFADQAQAIYGFADDADYEKHSDIKFDSKLSFLDRIIHIDGYDFKTLSLHKIYRTSSLGLKKIFSEVRKEVLDEENWKDGIHGQTSLKIKELADRNGLIWREANIADFDDCNLILFRTRAEALMASQFCDQPHSLRLSGYGSTLPAWLAFCFHNYPNLFISQKDFFDLWMERVENKTITNYDHNEAWIRLLRVAGRKDSTLDMRKLRLRLSQKRPPTELALLEFGLPGPIVGTIHASKGREANDVVLLLPKNTRFSDLDEEVEESRVLFVGATRARQSLTVGEGIAFAGSALESGRAYRASRQAVMIEVGRDGDISAEGLVGKRIFSQMQAIMAQAFLGTVANNVSQFILETDSNLQWRYRIYNINNKEIKGINIGALTHNFNNEIWNILKTRRQHRSHKPPKTVKRIHSLGISTIVLSPDDVEIENLHEPWASSGFLLTPKISAFTNFYFKQKY